ncbi:MAG TPA: DUF445 family protein, partial [Clostridiales bacterium]|nr:DUF445 family protein [Clostridiales bacterium]
MKFIIPIIVGAIIGYITNWFAIKMLFRPHHEIKILGVHVPFTPGLIPKEKSRIAKSVGETIGVHLLSPKIVTEALSIDKINGHLQIWIKNNLGKLCESDKTIGDLATGLFGNDCNKLLNAIKVRLADAVCSQLRELRTKNKLMNILDTKVYDKYSDDFYKTVKQKAELFLYELTASEEIKAGLRDALTAKIKELEHDTRALDEVIPESVVNAVKEYINDHSGEIIKAIKEILQNPSVKRRIKDSISEVVSQNTSKLVTMFMSPESIAEKVFVAIEKYIDNPENNKSIISIIISATEKIMKGKV